MKKIVLLSLTAMVFCGCSHDLSNYGSQIDVSQLQDKDPNEVTQEDIQANVASIFGTIDPEQDWNLVNVGSVTIKADADLDNIVKVQVLTESPFFNPDAKILSEIVAKKGESVTLNYEAPKEYTSLVAACVNEEGVYYIKPFAIGDESVCFTSSSAARARTRGTTESFPLANNIVLETKNSTMSFNAIRTQLANQAAAGDEQMKQWVDANGINLWTDKGWENERLWKATDKKDIGNNWKIENGCIYRTTDQIDPDEKAELETIFNNLLHRGKTGVRDKYGELKRDNLDLIRNSTTASLYNNHILSVGSPITITPVQLASTEAKDCQIYYYYYNPQFIPATVSEEEYVKDLPKFEAVNCNINAQYNGKETFFKSREYLLPYYGDNLSEMMEAKVMENYETDGKVYRFRNGQQWNNKDYYLSYFTNNTNDDGRIRVSLFADKGDTDYKNQLWQIFTDEGTGLSYLFNIGLQRFLLHQEATDKDYLTSLSASDVLAGDEIPLVIDMQNNCIRRTNNTTLGLGTDLDNTKKASRLCVSSDKNVTQAVGKWYMDECTDKSDLDLKTEIKRAATNSVTAVSNTIPAGYKVGFMIRKTKNGSDLNNLNHVKGVNNGCCYGFGSMNKTLNQFGDFAYSVSRYSMKIDDPRVLMFSANGKTFLAFEEGVDCQYSDVIIEITQGINEPITDPITSIEKEIYTVCIEDRPIADYDMNDVILQAERVDQTHIKVTVLACGAYDNLYIKGLNGNILNEDKEIHDILGAPKGTFVNTNGSIDYNPQSEIFEVGANTSIIEFLKGISIYDETINHTINFSEKGDDPHAIVVPSNFDYPAEHVNIIEAYPLFKNWASNAKSDNGWYNQPKQK